MSANVMYGAFVIWEFTLPHWLQGQIQGRDLPSPPYFWTKLRPEGRPPPPPPPYQRVCTLRSPQSTMGPLHFTLTMITTNRQILKLLAFLFVKFPWNQTYGCYYGPKTVYFSKKIGNKGHWNDLNFLNCNLAWNQTCLIAYSQRLKSLRKSIWDFLPHQRYPTTSYPSQCSWCV